MQAVTRTPPTFCDEYEKRAVTYQLTMPGSDGMVIASDRREVQTGGTVPISNNVNKIRLSPDGRFAWAFSGNMVAPIYCEHLVSAFVGKPGLTDGEAKQILATCAQSAIQEWHAQASGPLGPSLDVIVMASGSTRKIFRSIVTPRTISEMQGLCVSGQTANLAVFLPQRYYSQGMSVDALASLAACSICMAHDFDNYAVDGLDLAIYRDSSQKFEFVDSGSYSDKAKKLARKMDSSLARLIRGTKWMPW